MKWGGWTENTCLKWTKLDKKLITSQLEYFLFLLLGVVMWHIVKKRTKIRFLPSRVRHLSKWVEISYLLCTMLFWSFGTQKRKLNCFLSTLQLIFYLTEQAINFNLFLLNSCYMFTWTLPKKVEVSCHLQNMQQEIWKVWIYNDLVMTAWLLNE